MKYNTGCRYVDEWFYLCDDEENFPTSSWVKLQNKLILKKIKEQNIYFDNKKIEKVIKIIEKYRPYKLAPVQKFLHSIPYAYFPDGFKVWDEIFIYAGRGFGKNAFITDYSLGAMSNANNIKKYNIDIVATSEDQAKRSFTDLYDTIDSDYKLKNAFYKTQEMIEFIDTNSILKYYTSNAKTKDGLQPGCVVFDEIHAYEDYENIKVFTSALGKVRDAQTIYITTDGYVRGCVLDDFKEEAKQTLLEQDIDSNMFCFFACIEDYEKWDDEKEWIKANPMLPYLPVLRNEYRRNYKKALKRPQIKIEFITKRLNFVIDDVTTAVADWEDILATNKPVNWNDFKYLSCVGAIDYASVRDFIGVGLLFKKKVGGVEKYYFKHHTFIVAESLKLTNFKIDIDVAVKSGLVTIIPGKTMNPEYLSQWFLSQVKKYGFNIEDIACDDYRKSLLASEFESAGLPLTSVRSGPISHGKIAPMVEKLFADHNIVFGDDMMMRWYTNNVKVETDGKGNKTYKKIEPEKRKTDGFMAFIHAILISEKIVENSFVYNSSLSSYSY